MDRVDRTEWRSFGVVLEDYFRRKVNGLLLYGYNAAKRRRSGSQQAEDTGSENG